MRHLLRGLRGGPGRGGHLRQPEHQTHRERGHGQPGDEHGPALQRRERSLVFAVLRGVFLVLPEQADAEQLDHGCQRNGRSQRHAGASQRQSDARTIGLEGEVVEQALEQIPLADEARGGRHGGQTHGAEHCAQPEGERRMAQDGALPQVMVALQRGGGIGTEKQRALGQAVAHEVQHAHCPGKGREGVLPPRAENERRPQRGDGDPGVFGGGEGEQAPPVALLEGIENRQNGGERARSQHHHAERGQPGRMAHPLQQRTAKGEVGRIHHHPGHQRAAGATAAAVGAWVPLVKRQQPELGAEARQPQQAEEEGRSHAPLRPLQRVGAEGQALAQHEHGQQQRHAADFEQREHEQIVAPGLHAAMVGQQHERAAEAHHFPSDEKARAVLQAIQPERTEQRQCRASGPAAGVPRAAKQAGKKGGQQRGQHQPQCGGIGLKHHWRVAQQQQGLAGAAFGQTPQRAQRRQHAACRQQQTGQGGADEQIGQQRQQPGQRGQAESGQRDGIRQIHKRLRAPAAGCAAAAKAALRSAPPGWVGSRAATRPLAECRPAPRGRHNRRHWCRPRWRKCRRP